MDYNRNIDPFFNDEFDVFKRGLYNATNSSSRCSVGIVTAINLSPVTVNVQNAVQYFDKIQGFQEPPILQNVPVMQLSNAAYSIKTPLNIGDIGLLLWFDREVYTYLVSANVTPSIPDSGTMNNENACVFLPVMQKFSIANQIKQNGVDFVSSEISLMTQLITLLTDLNTFLSSLITAGAPYAGNPTAPVVGAYPIAITAASTVLETALATITTALTTFKGAQT